METQKIFYLQQENNQQIYKNLKIEKAASKMRKK